MPSLLEKLAQMPFDRADAEKKFGADLGVTARLGLAEGPSYQTYASFRFGSMYPRYKGGHPPKFTLPRRREIKKTAKSRPAEYDLPLSDDDVLSIGCLIYN